MKKLFLSMAAVAAFMIPAVNAQNLRVHNLMDDENCEHTLFVELLQTPTSYCSGTPSLAAQVFSVAAGTDVLLLPASGYKAVGFVVWDDASRSTLLATVEQCSPVAEDEYPYECEGDETYEKVVVTYDTEVDDMTEGQAYVELQ